MVDLLSVAIGAGGIVSLQIAWSLLRRRPRGTVVSWVVDQVEAEHQHLGVEIVETFDGYRFRKTGTDVWMWTDADINGNVFERWEASDWDRKGVFSGFHLMTYKHAALEAAEKKAEQFRDKLVSTMHHEAYWEDQQRQRAAFVERVVA